MQYPVCGTQYSLLNQDHVNGTQITRSLEMARAAVGHPLELTAKPAMVLTHWAR